MSNKGKYARNFAIGGGAIGLLFNLAKQYKKSIDNPEEFEFDFLDLLKDTAIGTGAGAVTGLLVGAVKDENAEDILKNGVNAYLFTVLSTYSDTEIPTDIEKKINKLISFLNTKLYHKLAKPPAIGGSSGRGTAIITSDTDIRLEFLADAGTLSELYEEVYLLINDELNDDDLIDIRRQEHSMGLFFETNEIRYRIDIVSMRHIDNGDGDLSLFVSSSSSRIKTNPDIHEEHFRLPKKAKDVVKMLKAFKANNDISISSIYIESLVHRAYEYNKAAFNKSIKNRIIYILDFIANNIENIRIVDPANTNNIISDSLTASEKRSIARRLANIVSEIINDERMIVSYFPNYVEE